MKAVIQRVSMASVSIDGKTKATIDRGLVVLLGIAQEDTEKDASFLAEKVRLLRIFEDDKGKLNRSLEDIGGAALIISQFTLYADTTRGRRPSFTNAAPYDKARTLYEYFVDELRQSGIHTETGLFGERMLVTIHNEGPVTIVLSTERTQKRKRTS